MLIAVRTDANARIGGGHVMRCLTLAEELKRRGCDVVFMSAPGTRDSVPALTRAGFRYEELGESLRGLESAASRVGMVDVIVVDSYSLDHAYESAARAIARKVVVFNDAPRRHDCDLLVDPSLGRLAGEYRPLLPAGATVLLGPNYAPLRPEFASARAQALVRRQQTSAIRRIFVSLGLTDLGGISETTVRTLVAMNLPADIDVVISPSAKSRRGLEAMAASNDRIHVHIDPPDIAARMVEADVAIGAGGTSCWERCCLGLPMVLVTLADNQADNVRALSAA